MSDVSGVSARMSRGCYEETAPVEFQRIGACTCSVRVGYDCCNSILHGGGHDNVDYVTNFQRATLYASVRGNELEPKHGPNFCPAEAMLECTEATRRRRRL